MIQWSYQEKKTYVPELPVEKAPMSEPAVKAETNEWEWEREKEVSTASGSYRKYLQENRRVQERQKKKIISGGAGMLVILILITGFWAMKDETLAVFWEERSIQPAETVRITEAAEETLPAASTDVIVENVPGNVVQLPVKKEEVTVTETPAPTVAVPPEETPQQEAEVVKEEKTGGEYRVQKGDTLAKISREHYGTMDMVKEICKLNKISDGDHIQVGEVLVLP